MTVGAGSGTLDGGTGNDTLSVDFRTSASAVNFSAANGVIADATNTLTTSGFETFDISTGSGNDSLTGGAGDDTFASGAGNDSLVGGGGADVLNAGTGTDVAQGGEGDDEISLTFTDADTAADTVDGGAGNDTLVTDLRSLSSGKVVDASQAGTLAVGSTITTATGIEAFAIQGTQFADTITGSAGSDEIDGNGGNDSLIGGAGDDTFGVDLNAKLGLANDSDTISAARAWM